MLFNAFFLLSIFISGESLHAADSCSGSSVYSKDDFSSYLKPLLVAETNDINTFCRRAMGRRFLLAKGLSEKDISENYPSLLEQYAAKEKDLTGWSNSMLPLEKPRSEAMTKGFITPDGVKDMGSLKRFMQAELPTKRVISTGSPVSFQEFEDKSVGQFDNWKMKVGKYFAKRKACGDLKTIDFEKCKSNLDGVLTAAAPRYLEGGAAVTLFPEIKELLTNPRFVEPIKKATLKLIERLEQPVVKDKKINVMDDLVSSFTTAGLSEKEARNTAWKVLGIIGSGGANLHLRLSKFDVPVGNQQSVSGLSAIASMLPLLDFKYTNGRGQLYSMPSSVQSSCDGKPTYHFWMSAYIAKKQAEVTGDYREAAAASYLAEKGYQTVGGTNGGRTPGNVLKFSSFSPIHNVVRMDMAYASAGAVFGASAAGNKDVSLSVDEGIKSLARDVKFKPALSADELKSLRGWTSEGIYDRWQETFNPDPTFNEQLSKIL